MRRLAFSLLLLAPGCVSSLYVEADSKTYDAVVPVYLEYTQKDPGLSDQDKARRRRLVSSLRARIRNAR